MGEGKLFSKSYPSPANLFFSIRRQLQADEEALVVAADGAGFGDCGSFINMAAVEAHPFALHVGDEELVLLQKIGVGGKAVPMGFLNFRNVEERCGNAVESFLLCHRTEILVSVGVFLVLVVVGGTEEAHDRIADIDGVTAVDVHRLPCKRGKMLIEDLGVLLLLIGGEGEDRLDDVEFLTSGLFSGKGVAVSRLTLPGKGSH